MMGAEDYKIMRNVDLSELLGGILFCIGILLVVFILILSVRFNWFIFGFFGMLLAILVGFFIYGSSLKQGWIDVESQNLKIVRRF